MFRWVFVLCLFVFGNGAGYAATNGSGGLAIASWNIERLGHGQNKDYQGLAVIGSLFDFIAVQEAMTAEGIERFQQALEDETSVDWEAMYSHPIGRGSYKEKYAFVWRTDRVHYDTGAVVYLDSNDYFAREPYSARFKDLTTDTYFVAATVHILFGRSVRDRLPEILELASYWAWLEEVYPGDEVFLMGDFNLAPTNDAWQPLYQQGVMPLIVEGATTLSSIDGRYANLYDQILVADDTEVPLKEAGIVQFPAMLGLTHEQARRYISDHAPVYVLTYEASFRQGVPVSLLAIQSQPEEGGFQLPGASGAPGLIIGNRNSRIAHRPDCPSYDRVSEHNRVYFETLEGALSEGYRVAGNCP